MSTVIKEGGHMCRGISGVIYDCYIDRNVADNGGCEVTGPGSVLDPIFTKPS